jgi:N-acetylglutamate synthase-like GNAT family acetyltransferase
MPFTIRLGTRQEQRLLEALQLRASMANPGDRELLIDNPGIIELPLAQIDADQVFVAEKDGVTLGFAAVLDRDDGDTELDGLFVEPDTWQSGVGRALVERSAEYAHAHNAKALHVIANEHALGFYEKCGFVTIGVTRTPLGPIASLMARKL